MVSSYLKGRLGNTTWIEMAAWVYAKKHGLQYCSPESSLAPHLWPTYYPHLRYIQYDLGGKSDWDESIPVVEVNDDSHSHKELPFEESWRNKNIIIGTRSIETGYFQSFKYISGYEDELRKAFNLDVATINNICACHIRGGDYLQLHDKHPAIGIEYLQKAVRKMFGETGCTWYLVFTDDLKYATPIIDSLTKIFREDELNLNFFLRVGGTEVEDFKMLMSCAYNITANSTFSVLAALLNPNPNKKVIVPHEDNFYGINNKHLDVSDLYPPEFIRIKY